MCPDASPEDFEHVASLDQVHAEAPITVRPGGIPIGLFVDENEVYAIDHRCPHMGFPLTEGSVETGILTCHWHHARFELSCGDTLDPFADDVRTFPVKVSDGEVYVNPDPSQEISQEEHWGDRLMHGLEENLSLIVAKSVIGLDAADVPYTKPVRDGAQFGVRFRRDGWGRGLTTLALSANLLDDLNDADRRRALYVGLSEVAANCAGEPPRFAQDPLSTRKVPEERLRGWFQETIEVRDAPGAERILRAAVQSGGAPDEIARMLVAAATDHIYLDTGHRLDFINKAFEILDHIGWQYAEEILPSLVPGLAAANRAEESASWRQPIDVAALRFETAETMRRVERTGSWREPDGFVDVLLGDDPHAIAESIEQAVHDGAPAVALSERVAYAAACRVAQFGTSNEFRDWNTVHHTYTFANAVDGLARRTTGSEIYRGVLDAAFAVYLDRFLNTPPVPIPQSSEERNSDDVIGELMETFEVEDPAEVNRAGQLVAEYLAAGGKPRRLKRKLGEVLLREDVGFHPRQNLEAAFTQFERTDPNRAHVHLIATARYLSAHTPTRRAGEQTFRIAERLHRGEEIHEAPSTR